MVSSTSTNKNHLHWLTIGGVASLGVLEGHCDDFLLFLNQMFYTNTTLLDTALPCIGIGTNNLNTNTILGTGLVQEKNRFWVWYSIFFIQLFSYYQYLLPYTVLYLIQLFSYQYPLPYMVLLKYPATGAT